uniref:Triokinase/FMN cyclase n=1 Tax=Timema monikensis TaxID=170555 RepID=A0A7R9DX44_9NEOP|nr:unnamed protein product [Timema monikensis]
MKWSKESPIGAKSPLGTVLKLCNGYVGGGMLTAAVAGSVFASPPSSSVLHAIRKVGQGTTAGTLLIIANYTGDILNFGLAVEWAKNEGLKVESMVVGEDCALLSQDGTTNSSTGRRGMCGLLFVYKITGAMSEEGKSLREIKATAIEVNNSMATIGVSLSACSLPGSGPLFQVAADEMELGLGVHGEAGKQKLKLCTAAETVRLMLEALVAALGLVSGDKVAVLINNLGATSQLEQWIIAKEVHKQFGSIGVSVVRLYPGLLMTSLDMAGVQVSVLKLRGHEEDWLGYLDATTEAPAWPGGPLSIPSPDKSSDSQAEADTLSLADSRIQERGPAISQGGSAVLTQCLKAIARALIDSEQRLNELDSGCGDGDCGTTLRLFAEGVLSRLDSLCVLHPATLFLQLAAVSESVMGGTSGAIYSLLFTTASSSLEGLEEVGAETWGKAWRCGIQGIMRYSTARLGDRTMLDALIPACTEFEVRTKTNTNQVLAAVNAAAQAAKNGCDKTKDMQARAGRASYVSSSHWTNVDAGAYAVAVWLKALSEVLTQTLSSTDKK